MYQKLIIAGNLGGDPKMSYTPDGKAVTTFSVATSERKDETIWWRVTVWEKSAETCSALLHKGSKVLVEGTLSLDKETGSPKVFPRKDGTYGASYEVTASKVRFLDSKPSEEIPY